MSHDPGTERREGGGFHISWKLGIFIKLVNHDRFPKLCCLQAEEFGNRSASMSHDPGTERREGGGFHISMVSVNVIEHVDCFTVGVSTYDDVLDVVDDTGKLEYCWFSCYSVLRHHGTVRHHVSSISDNEHVPNISLSKP